MKTIPGDNIENTSTLVKRFNNREANAFGEIYSLFYRELYYFTSKILREVSIDANDVLHDLFIHLWVQKNQLFEDEVNIKAYMYKSIRNYVCNLYDRKKTATKYIDRIIIDTEFFIIQVTEIENYAQLHSVIQLMPEECAKVINLYTEGYSIKEIAQKLNKSESTVYTQRQNAFSFIKNKLKNDKLFSLLLIIS